MDSVILKWPLSREHLECHAAEAVDVGARVDVLRTGLFGAHVRRCPKYGPGHCEPVRAVVRACQALRTIELATRQLDRLRHAEVGDHGVSAIDEDVRRLYITMYDAVRVRVGQCVGNFADERDDVTDRKATFALEAALERLALDERHREVHESVRGIAGGHHGNDVRMAERCRESRLLMEALDAQSGAELGRQHLHHDAPAESNLLGDEHAAHAAAGELAFDPERRA